MSRYEIHRMRESILELEHNVKKIENNVLHLEEMLEDTEKLLEYNKKHNFDDVAYYNSIRKQTIDLQIERLRRDKAKIELENLEESLKKVLKK